MFSIPGPWVSKTWSPPVFNTSYTHSHISIELNVFPVCQSLAVSCRTGTSKAKRKCPMLLGEAASLNTSVWTCRSRECHSLRKHISTHPGSSYTALPRGFKQGGRVQTPRGSLLFTYRVRTVQVCFDAEKPQWIVGKKNGASSRSRAQSYLTNLTLQNAPATHMLGPLLCAAL